MELIKISLTFVFFLMLAFNLSAQRVYVVLDDHDASYNQTIKRLASQKWGNQGVVFLSQRQILAQRIRPDRNTSMLIRSRRGTRDRIILKGMNGKGQLTELEMSASNLSPMGPLRIISEHTRRRPDNLK